MYRNFYFLCLLALLSAACSDIWPSGRARLARAPLEHEALSLVMTIPEGNGPGEVTIRLPDEEIAAGGPSALAIGPDGTIFLADILADRIVRLAADGAPLSPLAAPDVEDIAVDADGLVYAFARSTSRVTVLDEGGQTVDVVEIPRTMRWVTGLTVMPGGAIGLHTANQESVALSAQDLQRELGEGVPGPDGQRYRTVRRHGAARIELVATREEGDFDTRTFIERSLEVAVAARTGSLVFLGATDSGEIVVDVQDVVADDPILVERTVRRYGPTGSFLAEQVVPRGIYAPPHAMELGSDGSLHILRPLGDGVEVWTWTARGGAR